VSSAAGSTQALIEQLVRETGASDAPAAIRLKARALLTTYVAQFGEPVMPIEVEELASLLGISRSDEPPVLSPDAELVPDGLGGVTMRVNADRPETRQRFSIAHEISHAFFPEYAAKAWCRTDARYRNRANPDDFLEMLCDIGAAELLLPEPWFSRDAAAATSADGLADLATTYRASREATLRRYAEMSSESAVAVFLSWKLKPTQRGTVGNPDQISFFGITPEEERRDALRLRIDYAIPSPVFLADGHFLPKDKSVDHEGPIYAAAASGKPHDADCYLDFGQASGTYRVSAVPLWTPNDELGANGENAVVALLRPLQVRKPRMKHSTSGRDLFDQQ
jgi:hypothetical protein